MDRLTSADFPSPRSLPAEFPRVRRQMRAAVWIDALAIAGLLALIIWATWPIVGGSIIGQDASAYFYLNFSFLGDQLRAGHLPGWNPHQVSGIPFAGDPESGWTYVPAMLAFTLLPFVAAIKAYLLIQLGLQALGAYLLARALGFIAGGAFAAAAFFTLSTYSTIHTACCPIYGQIEAWVPLLLLGTLLATRAASLPRRFGAWMLASLAWSQIMAAWLGQGSYYVAMVWATFLLYLAGCQFARGERLASVALDIAGNGAGIVGLGGLLAMAGILPRLEANARSIIPGGHYTGTLAYAAATPGWRWQDMVPALFSGSSGSYPGMAVLILAALALLLAGGRLGTPFFALVSGEALFLAWHTATPLHRLLDLLPAFARLSEHEPERVLVFLYFGLSFLAGATVNELWRRRPGWRTSALALAIAALGLAAMLRMKETHPLEVATWIVRNGRWTIALLAVIVITRRVVPRLGRVLLPALVVLALLDSLHGAHVAFVPKYSFYRVNLNDYYTPSGAVRFLQAQDNGQPVRMFGYDPTVFTGRHTTYRAYFGEPGRSVVQSVQPLLVNNLATLYGLQDVQGYNPQQMQRYAGFMKALNGHQQEYHESNVLPAGLSSPLLDVLGVRYVVLPAQLHWGDRRLTPLVGDPVVYHDSEVQIVERPSAYPRAWLTHEVIQMDQAHAQAALGSRTYNLRQTALVESQPPAIAEPPANGRETVTFERDQPHLVQLRVQAASASLLVLSDLYYPAWQATVDGHPTKIYATDEALRGVAVPAGTHTVAFRYHDPWLNTGIAVSAAGTVIAFNLPLLAALFTGDARRFLRGRRRPAAESGRASSAPRTIFVGGAGGAPMDERRERGP